MLRIEKMYTDKDVYNSWNLNCNIFDDIVFRSHLASAMRFILVNVSTNEVIDIDFSSLRSLVSKEAILGVVTLKSGDSIIFSYPKEDYNFLGFVDRLQSLDFDAVNNQVTLVDGTKKAITYFNKTYTSIADMQILYDGAIILENKREKVYTLLDRCYVSMLDGTYKDGVVLFDTSNYTAYQVIFNDNIDVYVTKLKVLHYAKNRKNNR